MGWDGEGLGGMGWGGIRWGGMGRDYRITKCHHKCHDCVL